MANEAVIIDLAGQPKGVPIRFTVDDGTGIEKGTIMKITDPRTAAANAGSGDIFAGIASTEKVANDGSTSLGLWTSGVFDLKAAPSSIPLGAIVSTSGANLIKTASEAEIAAGKAIGKALETAAASEVIAVAVGIY